MDIRLNNLNKTIINCKKCPRLVKFINNDGKPSKIPDELYSKLKPYFCDTIKT